MPRLMDDAMQTHRIGGGNFSFSASRIDRLGAAEYTLVTVAVDETGSVSGFDDELLKMLVMAVEACKKSPRSDNILFRIVFPKAPTRSMVSRHSPRSIRLSIPVSLPEA